MRKYVMFVFACFLLFSIVPTAYADEKNCKDFATWQEAQTYFENSGVEGDPDGLDRDGDKLACETLPGFKENHVYGAFKTTDKTEQETTQEKPAQQETTQEEPAQQKKGGSLPKTALSPSSTLVYGALLFVSGWGLLLWRKRTTA